MALRLRGCVTRGCVTRGKFCNLSELLPQLLKSGDDNENNLVRHSRQRNSKSKEVGACGTCLDSSVPRTWSMGLGRLKVKSEKFIQVVYWVLTRYKA